MQKWIEKFSRKIGFTQTEVTIILFVLATFLIGLVVTYIKESKEKSSCLEFDYTVEDSLFNMAVGPIEMDDSTSNSELKKTVASKNEVLDFGSDKKKETVKRKVEILPNGFDINHATVAQLSTIPGIGKNTAQCIVDYRTKNGDFTRVEQLLHVKGIGKAKLVKLKKIIVFK
jgi:competence ComEA-like helix-hairpin-helix protein